MQFLKDRTYRKRLSVEGFTLIEIITVILLLGIIGVMGADIITSSFRGFAQTDDAMELFEEGKLALMRMEREIHHMVPNAVNIASSTDIYFGKIDVNAISSNGLTGLYYHPVPSQLYKIRDEVATSALPVGSIVSIYNTDWNTTFTDTSDPFNLRHVYEVTAVNGANHMTLQDGLGTNKPVLSTTSTSRYYPVAQAIRYYRDPLNPQILRRSQTQVTASSNFIGTLTAVAGKPLTTNLDAGVNGISFDYVPPSLTRNALVRINFTLTKNGTSLDFHKEVQVRNVP